MTAATAAVAWERGEHFTLTEVDLEPLRPDEVLVRLVAAGVCHTDVSAARGVTPVPLPAVLGHEGAGVVEDVGAAVVSARPGDRVLLTFTSCGRCTACRGGAPSYCEHHLTLNLFGGARADGSPTITVDGEAVGGHFFGQSSFATRAVVDERAVVVLPGAHEEDLVTLAPLGCGVQTGAGAVLNELRPGPGSVLAITGAGAVGLSAVMAAQLTPVGRTIVVDRVASRLALARGLGATDVVDTSEVDLGEAVAELTGGRGVDLALETTGVVPVLDALVGVLAVRGRCAVVGAPAAGSRASFDVPALLPGRTVTGVTLGGAEPQTFLPFLVAAHREGRFPVDALVRTYPFEQIDRAVADAVSGATVKPVLTFAGQGGGRS